MIGFGVSLFPLALLGGTWWGAYNTPDGFSPGAVVDLASNAFAVPQLGPELVTDTGFDTPASWTNGTGWTVSGSIATKTAGTGSFLALTGISLQPGKTYEVTFTVVTRTAGSMLLNVGGVDGTARSAAGTYTEYITAALTAYPGTTGISLYGNSLFAGTVDNFSVKEVLLGEFGSNLGAATYTMTTSGTGATSVESPAGTFTLTPAASGTARADKLISGLIVGATVFLGVYGATNVASIAVGTTQGGAEILAATTAIGPFLLAFTATATSHWIRFSRGNTTGVSTLSQVTIAQFTPKVTLRNASFSDAISYTCSSTTARTYVDSTGVMKNDLAVDQPRWDWSTGKRRLLNEGPSTNLALRSQEFDNASWSKSAATVSADAATSPDGTMNADKLQEDSTTAAHIAQQFYAGFTSGTAYSNSVFVKAGERNFCWLFLPSAAFGVTQSAFFDLSAGTVGTTSGTPIASITPLGNGYYRCRITATASATAGGNWGLGIASANGTSSYAGTTGSGIYVYGAQLEPQGFASSYIPTAGATVTRAVESAKIAPLMQAVVSRPAGTILVRGRLQNNAAVNRGIFGNDGTGNLLRTDANNTGIGTWNGSNTIAATLGSGAFNTSDYGVTLAFDNSGRAVAGNGSAAVSDANQVGSKAVTYLGRSPSTSLYGDGWYDSVVVYPMRVSAANLQTLTVV